MKESTLPLQLVVRSGIQELSYNSNQHNTNKHSNGQAVNMIKDRLILDQ